SAKAVRVTNGANLDIPGSTILRSRILDGQTWSALKEVRFTMANEDYSFLKISEVHYHPEDLVVGDRTVDGKDLEFLELKNTGTNAVDISGVTIDTAVRHTVPAGVMLPPKGFYVIASKPEEFYSYYGRSPSGNFSGNLSNAGEFVLINDRNMNRILSFTYSDASPWPAEADGDGYSLVPQIADPTGDPDLAAYWRRSANVGGSPFADDPVSTSAGEVFMEKQGRLNIYPNPTSGVVVVSTGEECEGTIKLRFISMTGTTVMVKDIDGTTVLDLSDSGLETGVYTVVAEHRGGTYMTKLVYLPRR
ncbi:MAG: lamin tail domain-containing protein, partial [Bacteroidales bacterium]|nr:lamin tail domain-containing protein [Bacteroidales bacterium]